MGFSLPKPNLTPDLNNATKALGSDVTKGVAVATGQPYLYGASKVTSNSGWGRTDNERATEDARKAAEAKAAADAAAAREKALNDWNASRPQWEQQNYDQSMSQEWKDAAFSNAPSGWARAAGDRLATDQQRNTDGVMDRLATTGGLDSGAAERIGQETILAGLQGKNKIMAHDQQVKEQSRQNFRTAEHAMDQRNIANRAMQDQFAFQEKKDAHQKSGFQMGANIAGGQSATYGQG